ncbi:hypothetical protein Golomagni_05693 [Golovinomyces magnicellulatus]|nr:hypothetical protein Golomagni_05693 [Golovinomyces magnicellulatus]
MIGGCQADMTGSGFIPKEMIETNFTALAAQSSFPCNPPVPRLNQGDCQYIRSLNFVDQGINAVRPNGRAWIGNQGPYTFKFTNRATNPGPVGVIVVLWLMNGPRDYQASFVNARRPFITASLPNPGDSIVISLSEGQVGGWAAVNGHNTVLTQYGQISNTWGEFNTKRDGNTFDVSREVDMRGNAMQIRANNGCVADLGKCVFRCINGARSCGNAGEYKIFDCDPPNPGAHHDADGMNGGCSGWGNSGNGHLEIALKRF